MSAATILLPLSHGPGAVSAEQKDMGKHRRENRHGQGGYPSPGACVGVMDGAIAGRQAGRGFLENASRVISYSLVPSVQTISNEYYI
jgi:hypothetical protein